jgi:hypothetical protein
VCLFEKGIFFSSSSPPLSWLSSIS